jgi:hypothetical protein
MIDRFNTVNDLLDNEDEPTRHEPESDDIEWEQLYEEEPLRFA